MNGKGCCSTPGGSAFREAGLFSFDVIVEGVAGAAGSAPSKLSVPVGLVSGSLASGVPAGPVGVGCSAPGG